MSSSPLPAPRELAVAEADRSLLVSYSYDVTLDRAMGGVLGVRWDARARAWRAPASPVAARGLLRVVGAHPLLDALAAADQGIGVREDALPYSAAANEPWRHQLRGAHWLADRPAALLEYGLGTGKTRTAVDALRLVGVRRALVVAPRNACGDAWRVQPELHAPEHFNLWRVDENQSVLRRSRSLGAALDGAERDGRPLLAVVNYDAIWRAGMSTLLARPDLWDAVVYDEGHKIKSPGSKRSLAAARLQALAPRRWSTTGTPLANSPLDAYGLFRALDPGIFGTSFAQFRARYAVMGGYQGRQVLGFRNLDDFRERYYSITLSESRDVLDLPPALHVDVVVDLPAAARRIYRDLADDFVAYLNGTDTSGVGYSAAGTITAGHALTRMLRLQQLTSGLVKTDDGEYQRLHDAKGEALEELLSDLDPAEHCVVFARFRPDVARIRDAAKACGRLDMELSGQRNDLREWQEAPGGAVLAVQASTGSDSINLTRARHCVYYSRSLPLVEYEQSLARVHRPGQTRDVRYYHLMARASIDGYIRRMHAQRREPIDAVLRGGWRPEEDE